jgi:hypothetical protein
MRDMRPRGVAAVALLPIVWVCGCVPSPKQRVQGKWVGERADNFSASQTSRAAGWASAMSFEFKGSSVVVAIPAETPREATFEIASAREDELTLKLARSGGGHDRVAFRFERDGRLRWQLGDGRSIVLRKVAN